MITTMCSPLSKLFSNPLKQYKDVQCLNRENKDLENNYRACNIVNHTPGLHAGKLNGTDRHTTRSCKKEYCAIEEQKPPNSYTFLQAFTNTKINFLHLASCLSVLCRVVFLPFHACPPQGWVSRLTFHFLRLPATWVSLFTSHACPSGWGFTIYEIYQ